MIILSRGSYVEFYFLLFWYFTLESYLLKNKLRVIIYSFCTFLVSFSTFRTSGVELEPKLQTRRTEQIKTNNEVKDTKKAFLTFYIDNGRLFSKDETTNWRLDIWQDVFWDMKNENILFVGYGYKSIIPQMLDPAAPGRLGRDGLNEHVHNYFVTILSRGGLFQLSFYYITFISNQNLDRK